MIATVKNFLSLYKGRKILVLGDMGELGENEIQYHKELGEYINHKNNLAQTAKIISIGNLSKNITNIVDKCETEHFDNLEDSIPYIKSIVKSGTILFLKASRSMKFEKIIELLSK